MKKVGIISNLMTGYGGVQTCILSLIKGLNNDGIVPDIISDQIPNSKLWEEQNLSANVNLTSYSISLSSYKKYQKILKPVWEFVFFLKTSRIQKEYDFLYIFQPNVLVDSGHDHLFYLSMSPRAKSFTKTPLFSQIKNLLYKYLIKYRHPIFEFQNYNCVINSNYTASYFEEFYKKKIEVIYPSNLIKKEEYDKVAIKNKRTVLFISRIASYKRPDLMLSLAEAHPEYKFFIVGGLNSENRSYYDELMAKIEKNRLVNVEVLTNLPHEKMVELLKQSEYYFFGARNEHFGITTVEAMLFGAIPFVHNSGGQKEIVPFEDLRFDDENILFKFKQILEWSDEKHELMLGKIREQARNFTEEVYISKMLQYLKK